jgi:hypothetical protein
VFCSRRCAADGRFRRGTQCNNLTTAQAAYIAGFLDADGSVILYGRASKVKLRVSFSNRSKETLDWIVQTTGVGNVTKTKRYSEKHAPAWFAFINSEAAETLLIQVAPYMITKQHQAELAISFHQKLRFPSYAADVEWQQRIREQMRELNKRGN